MTEPTKERKKLQVIAAEEPKTYGNQGRKLLNFQARDAEGKEFRYVTFRDTLFASIVVNDVLDAEVETKSSETADGGTRINRTVLQLFKDGQPIGGQKQGYGGGQWRGKSPEEVAAERASIEAQVAMKVCGELVSHGHDIGFAKQYFEAAILKALKGYVGELPKTVTQKPSQAQQRASAAPPGQTAGEQVASTELDDYPPELEDGGALTEPPQKPEMQASATPGPATASAKLTWGTVAARCMETSIRPEQVWAAANAHLGKQAVKSWNDMAPNKLSPDWAMQAIQDIKAGKV